jgi:fructokinase
MTRDENKMKIVSLGEVLWDVFDDQRRFLGGAPLNFSINATRFGHSVFLVSAVGNDRLGTEALSRIREAGLSTCSIRVSHEYPTATAEVRTDSTGHTQFFIRRPAAFDTLMYAPDSLAPIDYEHLDWIYFGTLALTEHRSERVLETILRNAKNARRFYDVNLREGHWSQELVERLSSFADVIKLNADEAQALSRKFSTKQTFSLEEFCHDWSERFSVQVLCVTLGSEGCAIFTEGALTHFVGQNVEAADTVGAGDAFSAGFLHGLGEGWPMKDIAAFANAVGALVASRPGATPDWSIDDCRKMLRSSPDRIPASPATCLED